MKKRGLDLSTRQAQVLRGLVAGLSRKEIARELGVSVHTVIDHIAALKRKLGAQSIGQMTAKAGFKQDLAPPVAGEARQEEEGEEPPTSGSI